MNGAALRFADVESLQDVGTYVARARQLEPDGAVRLQASGEVLAAWVRVLPGQGLLGRGLALGLRTTPLEGAHSLDTTVPLAGITDRLARRSVEGDVGTALAVPPTTVDVAWTAVTPPRSGWEPVARIEGAHLDDTARAGIAAVAQGSPPEAGSAAVAALRARVWGADLSEQAPGVPGGLAFAAYSLGFVRPGDVATLLRCGPWTRLSLPVGHVLMR